jgi:DNA polymerase III, gamma/tau subunits
VDIVIGQKETRERLLQLCREQRLPHAMMLCGPTGCGKMALAMDFAYYLLTEGNENLSDAQRHQAEAMLAKWNHPDLHFTYPVIRPAGTSSDKKMASSDFASQWNELIMQGCYFSMDQWLDKMEAANQQAGIGVGESDELLRKLNMKSSQGGYKVSIIWLPERMNLECANKLLKLLEEPPTMTVFIMICEDPEHLLETIRSRVQRIDVKKIDDDDVKQALVEQRGIGEEMAWRIARMANGNWLSALAELDADNENREFFDLFVMLMRLAYMRNIHDLRKWSDNVAAFGREKQKRMLAYFLRLVRENFMYNFGNPELVYMSQDEENFAKNFARFINEANVVEISELLQRCIRDISQNANGKIVFFDLCLKMIVLLIAK